MVSFCVFFVYFLMVVVSLFVSTCAIDFLERPVSDMTYCILISTLNSTHWCTSVIMCELICSCCSVCCLLYTSDAADE